MLFFRRCCTAVVAIGLLFGDLSGVASAAQSNAKQPQVVSVCVNNSTSTLRKSIDNGCIFGAEYKLVWSTRGVPPKFCINTRTREMTAAYVNTCPIKGTRLARPRSNNEMLGCADKDTGVMRWPVTGRCWWENTPVKWFAEPIDVAPPTATTSTTTIAPPTATTSTTVAPPTATTSTTVAPSTTTTLPDTTPPTVTLARSAATSSSAPISFTVTGNEDINCATLSLTAGTDFTLTNISTITSITQTSSDVCTIIAVSTATTNGDAVVSTLTRASTFSIDDTAGNSQTVLAGSPQSVTVTRNGEPNAPVISSTTAGNAQVTVVWSTPASNGSTITDYLIKYSLSADGTYTTFADGVSTATSATVTGLTNGTAYYFKVAAKNSVGTGSYSAASADATPTMPTLTISYAAGSGSGTAPVSPVSVLSGSTFTTPANTYTRTGYTFAGWSDGSATYAAAATYPSSGTVASNVTLTAQWTANTLTVTYNSQSGSSITAGSTSTGGSIAVSPGTPTRTGYTFAGWFVATSGGSAITFPYAHGQTANFTLYAQWTAAATCATGGACIVGNTGPGGGIVFYVHASGTFACGATLASTCKYLEAAPTSGTNLWTDATYVWSGNTQVAIGANARGTAIGTGYKNTEAKGWTGTLDAGVAARNYRGPNNLSDWYLPSKDEVAQLYAQRTTVILSSSRIYWSSSEIDATNAWWVSTTGGIDQYSKGSTGGSVRPVRAFG